MAALGIACSFLLAGEHAHEANPLMRVFVAPGLLLQRITTRRPDAGMIEVAVASLQEALAGDAEVAGRAPAPSRP